jgi:hypothetical protein
LEKSNSPDFSVGFNRLTGARRELSRSLRIVQADFVHFGAADPVWTG